MTERDAAAIAPEQLAWDSRARRVVTVYIPLAIFVIVMLFPFYWMTITAFKPDSQMEDYQHFSPFWVHSPTLKNFDLLLFHTQFPRWMMITMIVAVGSTVLSIFCSVLAAYAIERLRFHGSTNTQDSANSE